MNVKISKVLKSILLPSISFTVSAANLNVNLGKQTISDFASQNRYNIQATYSMSGYAGDDFNAPYDTIKQTTMSKYFQNLYKYSPLNEAGTCGFVALIQILSYYDTFFDDDIIEEKYERKEGYIDPRTQDEDIPSPGVLRQSYAGIYYKSAQDWAEQTKGDDYQTELIYRYNEEYKSALTVQSLNYDLTINAHETAGFADCCLPVRPKTNLIWNTSSIDIDKWIKEQIDNNVPVLLNIFEDSSCEGIGHAVVAYDYDEKGIIANFGYGSADMHRYVYSDSYKYVKNALTIKFDAKNNTNNLVIGGRPFDTMSFFNRAILREGEMYWKHSSDDGEYFDIEMGFADEKGNREMQVNGRTSYNCFDFTDRCWLYLQENCYYMYYISVKRYGRYGLVKYPEAVSYFEGNLYE